MERRPQFNYFSQTNLLCKCHPKKLSTIISHPRETHEKFVEADHLQTQVFWTIHNRKKPAPLHFEWQAGMFSLSLWFLKFLSTGVVQGRKSFVHFTRSSNETVKVDTENCTSTGLTTFNRTCISFKTNLTYRKNASVIFQKRVQKLRPGF